MSAQFPTTSTSHIKENERKERIKRSLALKPSKTHFNIDPSIMSPTSTSALVYPQLPLSSPPPSSSSFYSNSKPTSIPLQRTKTFTHHQSKASTSSGFGRGRSTAIKPVNRFHSSIDQEFRLKHQSEWNSWISRPLEMRVENDELNQVGGLKGKGKASDFHVEERNRAQYDEQWKSWMSIEVKDSKSRKERKSILLSDEIKVDNDAFYESQWSNWMSNHKPISKKPSNLEFRVSNTFFSSLKNLDVKESVVEEVQSQTRNQQLQSQAPSSTQAIFDPAPRNTDFQTSLPIMSRLPTSLLSESQLLFEESLIESLESETDYISLPSQKVPYTRTQLPELDSTSHELWKVLHDFRVIKEDYASGYLESRKSKSHSLIAPHPISSSSSIDSCPAFTSNKSLKAFNAISKIRESFNWKDLKLDEELEGKWYGVAFRSARKIGSESLNLYEADRKSHEEAIGSGGLMMYW